MSQLYVSVFGRASEGEGNTYWQTDQPDMVSTADTMLATDAAKDYFGATLESIDVIDGKGGTDILTARMDAGNPIGSTVAPVVSNVEKINIISRADGTLSFADITGFTSVSLTGSDDYTLTALPNNFELTLKDIDDEIMTLELDNDSGTADAMKVTLDNVVGTSRLVNDDDLETLEINSTGDAANKMQLVTTGFDVLNGTITVAGDQDLSLVLPANGGAGTNGTYSAVALDASTFDGALTVIHGDGDALDAKNFTGVDAYAFTVDLGNTFSVDNAEAGAALAGILEEGSGTLNQENPYKN